MIRKACLATVVAGLATLTSIGVAGAQNPSADEIVRSLRFSDPSNTTRGIRPIAPSAAAAPSAHSGATKASRQEERSPSVDLTVEFATGSARLTTAATRTLDELGRALTNNALAGNHFRIEGHTDTVGAPETNRALSEQRAATVQEYLATNFNVERTKVEAVGMGATGLLVQTGPNVAEPRNRRVTVINLGT